MNAADRSTDISLYRRLGGYDAIASIVDDMFSLLQADPRFARFAMGRSMDSHKRARQLIVDQLCALSGGPCFYIGRDMKTSHTGLKITDLEWNANLELTRQALEKNGISRQDQAEFLSMFERFKTDIVEG
ncbi:MAG TPA: group 1 truncated hemoglobin [Bryobacteraceae bacterium]